MEHTRDHLDQLLVESAADLTALGHDEVQYNEKLLSRWNHEQEMISYRQQVGKGGFRTAAYSLIAAGVLIGFIYTTGLQDSILTLQYKLKTEYVMLKTNIEKGRLIIGE